MGGTTVRNRPFGFTARGIFNLSDLANWGIMLTMAMKDFSNCPGEGQKFT
jgi:hypothetical protein